MKKNKKRGTCGFSRFTVHIFFENWSGHKQMTEGVLVDFFSATRLHCSHFLSILSHSLFVAQWPICLWLVNVYCLSGTQFLVGPLSLSFSFSLSLSLIHSPHSFFHTLLSLQVFHALTPCRKWFIFCEYVGKRERERERERKREQVREWEFGKNSQYIYYELRKLIAIELRAISCWRPTRSAFNFRSQFIFGGKLKKATVLTIFRRKRGQTVSIKSPIGVNDSSIFRSDNGSPIWFPFSFSPSFFSNDKEAPLFLLILFLSFFEIFFPFTETFLMFFPLWQ